MASNQLSSRSRSRLRRNTREIAIVDINVFRRRILCSTLCVMSLMTISWPSSVAAFTGPLRHNLASYRFHCSSPAVTQTQRTVNNPSCLFSTSTASNTDSKDLLMQQRTEILRSNSKLSLAPMMEYTDRHFRHLVRLLSPKTLLYTEMVAANAIAHERGNALSSSFNRGENEPSVDDDHKLNSLVDADFDPTYILRFLGQGHNPEGPSALQLGGSDPDQLFLASRTVYEFNQMQQNQRQSGTMQPQQNNNEQPPIFCDYSAINLNCGCPSPKVAGKGCFGAALMQDANLVREVTTAMDKGAEGTMPITVKCRIGTDEGYTFTRNDYLLRGEEEEYQKLKQFVETVASDGVVTDFQIHARIAILGKNFSPSDNRKVPPLRYQHVRRLAEEFPELNISLNGGVETLPGVKRELDECNSLDGVMVGRGFVSNPWSFAMAEEVLYSDVSHLSRPKNRMEVLEAYGRHADYEEERWDPTKIRRFMTKAVSHLFAGEPNGKRYRIALDEIAGLPKKFAKERKQNPNVVHPEQPPLSELIMDAAIAHLSEEVLYRTPKESYDKLLWEEEQAERKQSVVDTVLLGANAGNEKKSLVQEWQTSRKEDEREEKRLDQCDA